MAHLGFPQRTGDSSNFRINVTPPPVTAQLSSLYMTLGIHFSKLAYRPEGDSDIKRSRERLLATYGSFEWKELLAFCLGVYDQKQVLRELVSREVLVAELENNCKKPYLVARDKYESYSEG